jgi:hypothetical protein
LSNYPVKNSAIERSSGLFINILPKQETIRTGKEFEQGAQKVEAIMDASRRPQAMTLLIVAIILFFFLFLLDAQLKFTPDRKITCHSDNFIQPVSCDEPT